MNKTISILTYSALLVSLLATGFRAHAQNREAKYYNKIFPSHAQEEMDVKQVVLPPDSNSGPGMYRVNEFFSNGKPKLVTTSRTNDVNLKYDGPFVAYYYKGGRKTIGRFNNGVLSGKVSTFYPNGKLYQALVYKDGDTVRYGDCGDLTGAGLAENGKGKWIEYSYDFKQIYEEGPIENGVRAGIWRISGNKKNIILENYQGGKLISASYEDTVIRNKEYPHTDHIPIFAEGMRGFWNFLTKNARYPVSARREGISGKVVVGFMVEVDGSLTNFRIIKGVNDDLNNAVIDALKRSPKWIPASYKGVPVRVESQVPFTFALSD
ncbi:energy transducer TonB [Mucilaginibacter flavidus]|uniref:energy transducer TonB n=1 Tax=Mucilaginibacter flavidus TaxID=2949309 RepID=UPI002092966F|nr:energy transducer TonB [Mucilaginibacter flavidus]MCO5947716.1 TonB family protein [Mucilaginibacter flavidus]